MNQIWNEARIRAEIRRLDRMTGLHGSELQIKFTRSHRTLGSYTAYDRNPYFEFSAFHFDNPAIPDEMKLDVIRHEYAHYMEHMLYNQVSHSATWKKCCGEVDAYPHRLYSPAIEKHYTNLHRKEAEKARQYDAYTVGGTVRHPVFGAGRITAVLPSRHDRILEIAFPCGVKRLSVNWVMANCRRGAS